MLLGDVCPQSQSFIVRVAKGLKKPASGVLIPYNHGSGVFVINPSHVIRDNAPSYFRSVNLLFFSYGYKYYPYECTRTRYNLSSKQSNRFFFLLVSLFSFLPARFSVLRTFFPLFLDQMEGKTRDSVGTALGTPYSFLYVRYRRVKSSRRFYFKTGFFLIQ